MLQPTKTLPNLVVSTLRKARKATRANILPAKDSLARVNRLPPELLQLVFAMLPRCVHDIDSTGPLGLGSIDTIVEVCRHWRNVAFSTSFLWTHIDLSVDLNFDILSRRSTVWFKRSRGAPIHLHISDPSRDVCHASQTVGQTKLITPNSNRIRSLEIHSQLHAACLVCLMEPLWGNNNIIGSTKALSMRRPSLSESALLDCTSQTGPDEILLALRTLHLQNVYFPWDSPAYRGLVDLRLDFTEVAAPAVSQSTFAEILASSPQLATLKLSNVLISETPDWDKPTNYRLEHLTALNVLRMAVESLCFLLPMITLPRSVGGLSIEIPAHTSSGFVEVFKAFLNRSRLTTWHLMCHNDVNDSANAIPVFSHIGNLEPPIHQYNAPGHRIPHPPCNAIAKSAKTKQLYAFEELHVASNSANLEKIKPLVSTYGVQTLYLVNSGFYVGTSSTTFREFRNVLHQSFPDMNCILSSKNTVVEWPRRTIFDD